MFLQFEPAAGSLCRKGKASRKEALPAVLAGRGTELLFPTVPTNSITDLEHSGTHLTE